MRVFLLMMALSAGVIALAQNDSQFVRPLPAFSLKDVDGHELNSTNFTGKPLMIWFFASTDLPCRRQLPALLDLQRDYAANGFIVLGVSLDPREHNTLKEFAATNHVTFPIALAELPFIENCGSLTAVPTILVVEPHGTIINRYIGVTSSNVLASNLKAILNQSK